MAYELVVGLEIHTELLTKSKVFCGDPTLFGAEPNTQVSPVTLGLPGTLPILNKEALNLALITALACHCDIPPITTFDRKHYYYPDLPKNIQISQQYHPVGRNGFVELMMESGAKRIGINNIHLEEDAGKLIHPEDPGQRGMTWIDLNRAGMPLLEVVTEPDIRSFEELDTFMQSFRTLLRYLEVSDCKMQEGSLRFEVNISLRKTPSDPYGTKVEIKNIGSIKAALRAARYEYERQTDVLDSGHAVDPETRLWDDARGETRAMRSKEVAKDYRYFPEPDLVPIRITPEYLEQLRTRIPELQHAKRQRFMLDYGLSEYDAGVLVADKGIANYFEACCQAHLSPKSFCNWISGIVMQYLNDQELEIEEFPILPKQLAELVVLVETDKLNLTAAKKVFAEMVEHPELAPLDIAREKDLIQESDAGALEAVVAQIIAEHPGPVADYKAGKKKSLGFLMGQIMRASQGKANPKVVQDLLTKHLDS